MWRGQSDLSWRLDSSAFRRIQASSGPKIGTLEEQLVRYEQTLLQHATHGGHRYDQGRELSDFELLAKLQHHGAATRLVDFTRNALIAIWFACFENPKKPGLLVAFDSYYLEGYEKELEARPYMEVVKKLGDKNPVTWQPPSYSHRIDVQHSQFIYSKVSSNPGGSLITPSDDEAYRKFKLSPILKQEAVEVLFEVFDISKEKLFPDIDGFAQSNSVIEDAHNMHRW